MVGDRETRYYGFDAIEVGDIIRYGCHERKVRALRRDSEDHVIWVTFAILRSSWTNRPTTTVCRYDLKLLFGGIVKRATPLCGDDLLECLVQAQVDYEENVPRDLEKRYITPDKMAGRVL